MLDNGYVIGAVSIFDNKARELELPDELLRDADEGMYQAKKRPGSSWILLTSGCSPNSQLLALQL